MYTPTSKLSSTASTKVGENTVTKTGHLYLDTDTPIELVKSMLFDFMKYIGQLEDMHKSQQAAQEPSVTPAEPPVAAAEPETTPEATA